MAKLLILIPAYNEAENIERVVDNIEKNYSQYDYIVVNDGSKDKTYDICVKKGYKVIDLPINLGLAGGFQAGVKYAYRKGYDYVIQFDADGQHLPEYIEPMIEEIEKGYDIVIGSRFVEKKKPFSARMIGSRMISQAIKITTGKKINDPTSGMRLYDRKCMMEYAQEVNYGPEPDTISYLIKNGAKISEIQVDMEERVAGTSYLNFAKSISYMFRMMLDYIVTVDDFKLGYTNRTSSELMLPGGKGTNVSIVLKNLGISSTALGFVAGFTGDEIVRELEETGIHTDFVKMKEGISRINLKLSSIDGTEINGQGPDIPKEQLDMLMERLMVLKEGDILVLAGSIPATMPSDIYEQIMEKLYDRKVTIIVDATKDLLLNVLKYHPFLIKPNHHELGEIFNVELSEWDDVVPYAKKLQEMGAVNVLVSMGEKGGVLVSDGGRVIATKATATVVKNSVGAGDSSVAGFIAGWLEKKNYDYAFSMAMATGGASAASDYLATKPEVEASLKRVDLKYLV